LRKAVERRCDCRTPGWLNPNTTHHRSSRQTIAATREMAAQEARHPRLRNNSCAKGKSNETHTRHFFQEGPRHGATRTQGVPLVVKSSQQQNFFARDFNRPHFAGIEVIGASGRNCKHLKVCETARGRSSPDSNKFPSGGNRVLRECRMHNRSYGGFASDEAAPGSMR
jgi:hypothetical protein